MDGEELGGIFVIAVEELGLNGLWSTIKDVSAQIAAEQTLR
jgi:hypothetical protein